MHPALDRRRFLAALAASSGSAFGTAPDSLKIRRQSGVHLKIGLNAYSFNKPLMAGSMTLDDVIEFCAVQKVDGLDATGYYFPGYPEVPASDILYKLKRTAYLNGVTISGTGVRNDFTLPDPSARK